MDNTWTILGLGTITGHHKMSNFVTSHKASDSCSSHWHAGCRNIHQSSSCSAQCPLSDRQPIESWFPADWTAAHRPHPRLTDTRWPHPARRSEDRLRHAADEIIGLNNRHLTPQTVFSRQPEANWVKIKFLNPTPIMTVRDLIAANGAVPNELPPSLLLFPFISFPTGRDVNVSSGDPENNAGSVKPMKPVFASYCPERSGFAVVSERLCFHSPLRTMQALSSSAVLQLFGFLIGLSSSLDPRDPNVCSLWESYTTSVKESYSHPYDHVTEEPCSDPRTSFRCSRHRITYKTAYRQAVKTEYRRRYHCCPGYYESGGRCVQHDAATAEFPQTNQIGSETSETSETIRSSTPCGNWKINACRSAVGLQFLPDSFSFVVKPHCSQECVHGRCVAPNRCQCEKGWRGDDCSSWGAEGEHDATQRSHCRKPFKL
ncbi:hypothetical protein CCH79_00015500 [Gambusia affinis]|uniref:EMI domain-containing protein n=1 Tax=Gambusia affinis TaxID=33528 RepID=A0A315VPH2_GAMAF|nr:hypothetical protein CCH79_00015500 [Gambusia affinis]